MSPSEINFHSKSFLRRFIFISTTRHLSRFIFCETFDCHPDEMNREAYRLNRHTKLIVQFFVFEWNKGFRKWRELKRKTEPKITFNDDCYRNNGVNIDKCAHVFSFHSIIIFLNFFYSKIWLVPTIILWTIKKCDKENKRAAIKFSLRFHSFDFLHRFLLLDSFLKICCLWTFSSLSDWRQEQERNKNS